MFTEMRRRDRQLGEDEARAILEAGEYGILATVGEDGQPMGTPLSYVVDGGCIWFHGAKAGQKQQNMAVQPKVCFTVVGATQPIFDNNFTTLFESAMVYGTVSDVADEPEKERILLLICRKYLPDHMDKAAEYVRGSLAQTMLQRISIDHITGKAKRMAK